MGKKIRPIRLWKMYEDSKTKENHIREGHQILRAQRRQQKVATDIDYFSTLNVNYLVMTIKDAVPAKE